MDIKKGNLVYGINVTYGKINNFVIIRFSDYECSSRWDLRSSKRNNNNNKTILSELIYLGDELSSFFLKSINSTSKLFRSFDIDTIFASL